MRPWRKVLILLTVNIALMAFALYFFNYMRIINYQQILSMLPGQKNILPQKIEDPFLLEKEELAKKWEALNMQQMALSNQHELVNSNMTVLADQEKTLQSQREAFLNEQALEELKKEEANAYMVKITEVATQIAGMPPQTAAEILNLQDDLQVVDIFKKMEKLAIANGQASTVPFLLTLLEREKAASVQTLMLAQE